jgi:hypothetical protein
MIPNLNERIRINIDAYIEDKHLFILKKQPFQILFLHKQICDSLINSV